MGCRKPVQKKPSGPVLAWLFRIFREREFKLNTAAESKTNEEMSRASR